MNRIGVYQALRGESEAKGCSSFKCLCLLEIFLNIWHKQTGKKNVSSCLRYKTFKNSDSFFLPVIIQPA